MNKYLLILFLIASQLEGYGMGGGGGGGGGPSTTPPTPTKAPPAKKYTRPQMKHINKPNEFRNRLGAEIPAGPLFYHPGLVWLQNGRWTGSDNFTNISKNMALQVNLVKPSDLTSPLTEETIRSKIAGVFEQSGITLIQGAGEEGKPPLPFFEMQVMIFPVKDGYAAALFSHLFEDAPPSRLRLGENEVFQSITWQQANLVVGPGDDFEKLLSDTIETISKNFTKRLATYQAAPKSREPTEESLPIRE